MSNLLMLAAPTNVTWYLIPLAVVISLVYSASRYESPQRIARRATRLFAQIMICMGAVFALLYLLSGSLWIPMVLHALLDLCQFALARTVLDSGPGVHAAAMNRRC